MEALASLLILGILMTTITAVIQFSLVMTSTSIGRANASQELINELKTTDYPGGQRVISFSNTAISINAAHNIIYHTNDGITAFRPDAVEEGTP